MSEELAARPGTSAGTTSAVTLRAARAEDATPLAELAALTFPLACPPDMPAEDQRAFIAAHLTAEHFRAHLRAPGHLVLVAEDVGALVGYTLTLVGEPLDAELAAVLADPARSAYLSKCYLHPAAQGSGVAGRLMSATLDAAREAGANGVVLGVNGRNARAQAFYRRAGFAVVGGRTFAVGRRVERDLVLFRPL